MQQDKTLMERVFHAVLYEVCAMIMLVPLAAWLMGKGMGEMGWLAFMMSCSAMLWNMVFNALFDKAEKAWGLRRTPLLRVAHALLFEGGLVFALVPLAAWWLNVSWWEAFLLDVGFFVFFLPYTYVFNLVYDLLRQRVMKRRHADRLCMNGE
ncbi:multidrug/biocide efflux PACE transporter [uncultured Aquitalea sp.]|uniref:multidrug/biocide efflux PACE transporter n=1 Tax=uncultured Aquitalea sp. TaxID=540272 RepID=UPI0025EC63A2|nr:multidrug/biocide efflux PACE transporter [uncultured Aquitalea sp.]